MAAFKHQIILGGKPIKMRSKAIINKRNNGLFVLYSLKTKLIIGFVIPLFFLLMVGSYAYRKASLGMLENYENSTMQTIQMAAQYMDFGFQSMEADALQLHNDEMIVNYVLNQYKDDPVELKKTIDYTKNMVTTKKVSNSFIDNIHIITSSDIACITTAPVKNDNIKEGFFRELMEVQENALKSKSSGEKWAGFHTLLDEKFNLEAETYICSQYRMMSSGNAAVVIDVSTAQIEDILKSMELGEGSMAAFITADGREKVVSAEEFSFLDQNYYKNAIQSGEPKGSGYIKINGKDYLFMYCVCDTNGACICSLVPKSHLMREAESLKTACVVMIVLSCVFVFVVGMLIILSIGNGMNSLTKRLSSMAQGDLTVDMGIQSKSEFGILAGYIKNTVNNTRNLILQALHITNQVSESIEGVLTASESLKNSTGSIETSVEEINAGIRQQAEDAQQCLNKMDNLSDLIIETKERVMKMQNIVEEAGSKMAYGNEQMNHLKEKETETSYITGRVAEWNEELLKKTNAIKKFIESINEISEETTLLSLNASIEAARAGEAGKGFAVVAEQIKKLADNSQVSSKEIEETVKEIDILMNETIELSRRAKQTVEGQDMIVSQIENIFVLIYDQMGNIHDNVAGVSHSMQRMMEEREGTLGAVESISGVLQQTAAASSCVKEMVADQTEQISFVEASINNLEENTKQLITTVKLFKVE